MKVILQSCDFIGFEGGPNPPVYVHVLDAVSETEHKTGEPKIENGIEEQEIVSEIFHKTISEEENPMANVSENLPAKNNPFSLRKNTKLIFTNSEGWKEKPRIVRDSFAP